MENYLGDIMHKHTDRYVKGDRVVYYLGLAAVVHEVKRYADGVDLVIKLSNGKLVQVECWKVERA